MKRYTTYDLIMIALMAALGLGTKQLIRPVISLFTTALMIPGGALAGGFYMLWLVLTKRFVPKFGSGTFFGLIQGFVVTLLPFGSFGFFNLIIYPLPGIFVDLVDLLFTKKRNSIVCSILEGVVANLVGTISVTIVVFSFQLDWILLFVILLAIFSGNLGGIIAHLITNQVKNPVFRESIDFQSDIPSAENKQKASSEEKEEASGY